MTKQFLYLLFLGFFVLACHGKVIEEPVAPPTSKPEQEKPPCLTCNYDEDNPSGCVTCADEQVSEIYTDVKAKVVGNINMTKNKSTLSIALGSIFVASMAVSSGAVASTSPFAMASLDHGYMVAAADKAKEGKCGEGKCGANKKAGEKMKDGNCGANAKMKDGKCGGEMKAKEGTCGGDKGKEGKCGGTMK